MICTGSGSGRGLNSTGICPVHLRKMDGADEAGVVRANDVGEFDGMIEIFDLHSDQAALPMSPPFRRISWRGIPGCRRDDLVIRDLPVSDFNPVSQAASRGVDHPDSFSFRSRLEGRVGGFAQVSNEFAQDLLHEAELS